MIEFIYLFFSNSDCFRFGTYEIFKFFLFVFFPLRSLRLQSFRFLSFVSVKLLSIDFIFCIWIDSYFKCGYVLFWPLFFDIFFPIFENFFFFKFLIQFDFIKTSQPDLIVFFFWFLDRKNFFPKNYSHFSVSLSLFVSCLCLKDGRKWINQSIERINSMFYNTLTNQRDEIRLQTNHIIGYFQSKFNENGIKNEH